MTLTPKIGAFVLETLTTGMYTNELDVLRELVQNASDAVRCAERDGLLRPGQGRVEIALDPGRRCLTIRDNGIGIPHAGIDRLVNIGMSDKQIGIDAGFRGIGRLAGIAYCRSLEFRTSAKGETVSSTVRIDCDGLRKAMDPAVRQAEELGPVMARYCEISSTEWPEGDHFFEVVLDGIAETTSSFLDWQFLERYLSQVAPVEYDAQRFLHAPVITRWAEANGVLAPCITLVIRTPEVERQVFKPYKNTYTTRRDSYTVEIKDVGFYPEEIHPDAQFWLWYGKSDLPGMIDDDQAAGLRLRKNNISIGGPERIAELFAAVAESNSRFNAYYIGEIHILSPEAVPNARRDGFEDIGSWPGIRSELMKFVRSRCDDVRATSDARNRPTAKVVATASALVDKATGQLEAGLVSAQARDKLMAGVEKEEQRAIRALSARRDNPDTAEITAVVGKLKCIKERLGAVKTFTAKGLRPDLDRKEVAIINAVLDILQDTLDPTGFAKARAAIMGRFGAEGNACNRH